MTQAMKKFDQSHEQSQESEIRNLINEFTEAVRAKDINRVMEHYSSRLRAFDAIPPLESTVEDYRKNWQMCFDTSKGPITFELRDVQVEANDNLAFCHALNHFKATTDEGDMDLWMRVTAGYRKENGKWTVVHEHISVPFDPKTDKAMLDLQP